MRSDWGACNHCGYTMVGHLIYEFFREEFTPKDQPCDGCGRTWQAQSTGERIDNGFACNRTGNGHQFGSRYCIECTPRRRPPT